MASTLAAAMVASMVPYSVLADGPYTATSTAGAEDRVSGSEATQGQTYITDKDGNVITNANIGYDAILTKSLVIEEDANIPAATFSYKIESPSGLEGNDAKYVVKANGNDSTVSVFRGINVDKIAVRGWNTDDNELATAPTYSHTPNPATPTNLFDDVGTITLNYASQQVTHTENAATDIETKGKYTITESSTDDDDVSIVDYKQNGNTQDKKYYTANKSMLLDFTNCGFTEPGIYRYIITENDTTTLGVTKDSNPVRTLDVYVEDNTTVSGNNLKITGYVLYVGAQGGAAVKSGGSTDASASTTVDGKSTVKRNGFEVADATKSSGWQNTYETSNLTVGKRVEGNQGSKDKYFKYTVTVAGAKASDSFRVEVSSLNGETNKETDMLSGQLATDYPNAATKYLNSEIFATPTDSVTSNKTTYFDVSGTTGKAYTVYLKNGDYVTLTGLPKDANYTIAEDNEDYNQAFYGDFTDTGSPTTTGLTKLKNALASGLGGAHLTDGADYTTGTATGIANATVSTSDLEYMFINTKEGTLPTGIIMSVAPAVGIVLVGLIAALAVIIGGKKRRDELEEES